MCFVLNEATQLILGCLSCKKKTQKLWTFERNYKIYQLHLRLFYHCLLLQNYLMRRNVIKHLVLKTIYLFEFHNVRIIFARYSIMVVIYWFKMYVFSKPPISDKHIIRISATWNKQSILEIECVIIFARLGLYWPLLFVILLNNTKKMAAAVAKHSVTPKYSTNKKRRRKTEKKCLQQAAIINNKNCSKLEASWRSSYSLTLAAYRYFIFFRLLISTSNLLITSCARYSE